jgi:hypothetical protein
VEDNSVIAVMILDPMLTIFRIALILNKADSEKTGNLLKFRPQYVDFFCLPPARKMRIHSSVILIRYQIYLGILCSGDKLQVSPGLLENYMLEHPSFQLSDHR